MFIRPSYKTKAVIRDLAIFYCVLIGTIVVYHLL